MYVVQSVTKSTKDIASMAGLYSLYVKYLRIYYVVQQCYANETLQCWAPSELVADSFARAPDVFPPLQYIVDDVFFSFFFMIYPSFMFVSQPALEALCKYLNANTCTRHLSKKTFCAIYNANAPFAQHLYITHCTMQNAQRLHSTMIAHNMCRKYTTYLLCLIVKGLVSGTNCKLIAHARGLAGRKPTTHVQDTCNSQLPRTLAPTFVPPNVPRGASCSNLYAGAWSSRLKVPEVPLPFHCARGILVFRFFKMCFSA